MERDRSRHPCFNAGAAGDFGRVHLPVAPKCNVQCHYCSRKYDCPNESRPGVTSALLSPRQALHYLEGVVEQESRIAVVGIAGPGDPFANAEETLETLSLVRSRFPEMLLCVSTNGLELAAHAGELGHLGVSHLTLTINAVDPSIGAGIYAWVRAGSRRYHGAEAARVLLERQLAGLAAVKALGMTVKINTILIPGINDGHVGEVARVCAERGADRLNCIPLLPSPGSRFEAMAEPDRETVERARRDAERYLPQMRHCTRCRADAVGLLHAAGPLHPPSLGGKGGRLQEWLLACSEMPLSPGDPRPYVAVASLEGALVNEHLGRSECFLIYEPAGEDYRLVETRPAPPPGCGDERWRELALRLADCRAVLASAAGAAPTRVLRGNGIEVLETEGPIGDALDAVYRGGQVRQPVRRRSSCGCGGVADANMGARPAVGCCRGEGSGCG